MRLHQRISDDPKNKELKKLRRDCEVEERLRKMEAQVADQRNKSAIIWKTFGKIIEETNKMSK